jgi:hypothetical protein
VIGLYLRKAHIPADMVGNLVTSLAAGGRA